jgi:hypothetical protein
MLVKLARVEITGKALSPLRGPKKDIATFREIMLSVTTQRSLLELEQLMHYVSINLHLISTVSSGITRCHVLTRPNLSFGTKPDFARMAGSPMLPRMKRAELRILRSDSEVCSSILGPIAMSRQYSTVAAHRRSVSAPCAGCFKS